MEDKNINITNFARRLYNLLSRNTVLGSNNRTNVAISACIMYNDVVNNSSKLMETLNFNEEMSSIILGISKLNESTGIIQQMNNSENMFTNIKLLSSAFYGEIYPEKTLPMKMCYVDKVTSSVLV